MGAVGGSGGEGMNCCGPYSVTSACSVLFLPGAAAAPPSLTHTRQLPAASNLAMPAAGLEVWRGFFERPINKDLLTGEQAMKNMRSNNWMGGNSMWHPWVESERLKIFYNPGAGKIVPNEEFGIAFNALNLIFSFTNGIEWPDGPYRLQFLVPKAWLNKPISCFNEGDRCNLDLVPGCTDPTSPLYDPLANVDDGSCSIDLDTKE